MAIFPLLIKERECTKLLPNVHCFLIIRVIIQIVTTIRYFDLKILHIKIREISLRQTAHNAELLIS